MTNHTILKFKLKPNFRDPISISAVDSIFKGREHSIKRLGNIIKQRKSATVLLGGTRGIGKTSFAREALRLSKKDGIGPIVVESTLATVNMDPKKITGENGEVEIDFRKKVLSVLVRSLYFTLVSLERTPFIDDKLKNKIETLYEKTYYTEETATKINELKSSVVDRNDVESTSTITHKLDIGSSLKFVLKWITGIVGISIISFSDIMTNFYTLFGPGWFIVLLTLYLCFILFVLSLNIEYKITDTTTDTIEDKLDKKIGNTGVAKYDLSVDTLEIGLRDVLDQLSKKENQKVVFVLDELDKLDENSTSTEIKSSLVYNIVKPLKNLFTLSGAIFIFIVGDDSYRRVEDTGTENPYSGVHTIFTDRIFLSPLYYRDISSILENYKEGELIEGDDQIFEKFKNYIGWQAKNHIFDAHNLIEAYTDYQEDSACVHIYTGDIYNRGNIADDWTVAAAIQVYIAATYDEKMAPGESTANEKLYLTLSEFGGILYRDKIIVKGHHQDDDFIDILDETTQARLHIGTKDIGSAERSDLSGALESMLLKMENSEGYELIDSTPGKREISHEDGPIEENTTRYTLRTDQAFPDIDVIKQKTRVTKYEEKFMTSFKTLTDIYLEHIMTGLNSFKEHLSEYKRYSSLATKIRNEVPRFEPKSLVESDTQKITEITKEIYWRAIDEAVKKTATEHGYILHSVENTYGNQGQAMWDYDPNLAPFYQHLLKEENYEGSYLIISKNNRSLVLGFDLGRKTQGVFASIPRSKRITSPTRALNIVKPVHDNVKKIWRLHKIDQSLNGVGSIASEIVKKLG